jgi:hypothetical protein
METVSSGPSIAEGHAAFKRIKFKLATDTAVAWSLGILAEFFFWLPVVAGAGVAFLGTVGSERLGLSQGSLEPWMGGMSAASASIAVFARQARLRQKANAWFDFVILTRTLILKTQVGILSLTDLVGTYSKERMKLQSRLQREDSLQEENNTTPHAREPDAPSASGDD